MLLVLFYSFISGTFIGSLINAPHVIFACLIFAVVFYFCKKFSKKHKELFRYFLVALFGLSIGLIRIEISNFQKSELNPFVFQKVTAVGIISDAPDEREKDTLLTITLSEIGTSTPVSVSEKILVIAPADAPFQYGDKVKIETTLNVPTPIVSGDRSFDYVGYLKVRSISYIGKSPKITFIEAGHGGFLKNFLFGVRKKFERNISKVIVSPKSSLLFGMLFGAKHTLSKTLLADFRRLGISHVVDVTGWHITLVAKTILGFLSFLPKNLSFSLGAIGIILVVMLSSGNAGAWRAAIMVLATLFTTYTGRRYSPARSLALATTLMLLWNPTVLVFDASFQFSVLSLAGLIYVSPILDPYIEWIPERFKLREIISATVSIQVAILPYILYNTGTFSALSLPINILVLSVVPYTMFFGFLTGAVGFFSTFLSYIPAFIARTLLMYILKIVSIGVSLPATFTIPAFSPFGLLAIYAVIIFCLKFLKKKTKTPDGNQVVSAFPIDNKTYGKLVDISGRSDVPSLDISPVESDISTAQKLTR